MSSHHLLNSFEQKVYFNQLSFEKLHKIYIKPSQVLALNIMDIHAKRIEIECYEIDAGHFQMITYLDALVDLLSEISNHLSQMGYALDLFDQKDEEGLYKIFQEVVDSGCQFPYESSSLEEFYRQFFTPQGQVYVCHSLEGKVVGGFYLRANFPGRSSHIANAAYMIHNSYRGKGLGSLLIKASLHFAKDLNVEEEPSAPKKAYKMTVDFGKFGIRTSVGRFTQHTVEEIKDKLVLGVLNFSPRKIGNVTSDVLILGVQYPKADSGEATFITPGAQAKIGGKLF